MDKLLIREDRFLLAHYVRLFCRFEARGAEFIRSQLIVWRHVGAVCDSFFSSREEGGREFSREEIKAEERKAAEEFPAYRESFNPRRLKRTLCESVLKPILDWSPFDNGAFPELRLPGFKPDHWEHTVWFLQANPCLAPLELDISGLIALDGDTFYRRQRDFFAVFASGEVTEEMLRDLPPKGKKTSKSH